MVGDGIAIEPMEALLRAPFDGTVSQLQSSQHAITLKHASGLEVLMHIGIDTVMLKGQGFKALVEKEQHVSQGQPLIEFDMDAIAQTAKSLVTAIVLTNADGLVQRLTKCLAGTRIEAGDLLLSCSVQGYQPSASRNLGYWQKSPNITIAGKAGIHARPAAALVKLAKGYQADIEIACKGERTNAKSLTNLLNLNIQFNDSVMLYARGEDAKLALSELVPAIKAGLGDDIESIFDTDTPALEHEASLLFPPAQDLQKLTGVMAAPGMVAGFIHRMSEPCFDLTAPAKTMAEELLEFDQAIFLAHQQLAELRQSLEKSGNSDRAKIFAAHQELLGDPECYQQTVVNIKAGMSAAKAWHDTFQKQADQLRALDNPLLRERAADLLDVGKRVLRPILGLPSAQNELPRNAIVIADDLTPSDTATLDLDRVIALCTVRGGATSHSAILARSMGLPAIAGLPADILTLKDGCSALVNADQAELIIEPSEQEKQRLLIQRELRQQQLQKNRTQADKPAITRDGIAIEVVANIGSVRDAAEAQQQGADGVGLLRSEFLFMNRTQAPSEEEQYQTYRAAAEALGKNKPLIIRTLDVGGDKPLSYLPIDKEDNPFLGERGIRIGLDRPALLRQQLRAILRAAQHGQIHVMFPMVSDGYELKLAKQILTQEQNNLGVDAIPVGIMIEVPSAALMADSLADDVDFFSIGTNDLTQYTLAMDRGHAKLAALADALHPAVLRMIDMTVRAANQKGKWVGVCGGLASESLAVPVLVGLGVKELSVSIPTIADVKATVRDLDARQCRRQAEAALRLTSAREVREFLSNTNTATAP